MRVAIVGAGITGLTCAWQLQQLGVAATVFEATNAVGGPIRSVRRDGFLAEVGPHTLQDTQPAVDQLLQQLGIADERIDAAPSAHKRYLVRNGTLHALPSSPPQLLRSKLYSRSAKLNLLREPLQPRRTDGVDESVTNFVTRRLGRELLDYGVELLVNGVWAGDPNKLSARYAFPRMWALERDHGSLLRGAVALARRRSRRPQMFALRDGNGTLCTAIAARLDDVRLGTPVQQIERTNITQWVINGEHFDEVVLAAGAQGLGKIELRDPDPLDFNFANTITHPPLTVVTLGFRAADVPHPLDGFGVIIPVREQLPVLGVLFTSTLFAHRAPPGHVTLACFVGGARTPHHATAPDRVDRTVAALRTLLGVRGEPIFVEESFHARAIPQVEVGYGEHLAKLDAMEHRHVGLHIAGNVRGRVAVGDLIADATQLAHNLTRRR